MKKVFRIEDKTLISNILEEVEFGTLAICENNIPYSIPINFVEINGEVFFHGSKKGKKIEIIKQNAKASFSLVDSMSILPSYFSTDKGNACPATHLYKSIIIDGEILFIEEYEQKAKVLQALMQKLQKEGGYIPLDNEMYKKAIAATCIYKLETKEISAKFKLGQDFNEERFKRVSKHLKQRASKKDLETLDLLNKYYKKDLK